MFSAIYRYRGFIIDSVKRDFQSRYQTSFLGAAWLILQPIAMISVYTLIFSELMRARPGGHGRPFAYSIYLCSGVLTRGLFTETLNSLVNVFLTNANILKKLSFPRICLPIIVTASAFINFLIIFGLFVLFLIVTGNFPGMIFFEIIPVLIVQMLFTLGLGDHPRGAERFCPRRRAVREYPAAVLVLVYAHCLRVQNAAGVGLWSAGV